MYSPDLINEVLSRADVVEVISHYIDVVKKGRNYIALCPFHDDSTPSMNISKDKQIWKCFACGTGGNAITFVQKYERISFAEAVKKTAELVGFHDPRLEEEAPKEKVKNLEEEELFAVLKDLTDFYVYGLSTKEGEIAREYLTKRGISPKMVEKYRIGYAPLDGEATIKFLQGKKHSLTAINEVGITSMASANPYDRNKGRLVFPLEDASGRVVGFSARRLSESDEAKYVNSTDNKIFHKSQILYNYHRLISDPKARQEGYVYLTEGFMDVIALDKAGINNAVALMGTALTQEHIALLKRLKCEIRLCCDGDLAGQQACMKAILPLAKAGLAVRVVDYAVDSRDPDEIVSEDGTEALKTVLNRLLDPFSFQMQYYISTRKVDSKDERKKVLTAFLPYIASLKDAIEKEDAIAKLSKASGYETSTIRELVSKQDANETTSYAGLKEDYLLPSYDNMLISRLKQGEGMILSYMIQDERAITYFKDKVGGFSTNIYEAIALFMLELKKNNPDMKFDFPSLSTYIQESALEEKEEMNEELTALAIKNTLDSYNDRNIAYWKNYIDKEKLSLSRKAKVENALKQGDISSQSQALEEFAKAKKEDLSKGKEGN